MEIRFLRADDDLSAVSCIYAQSWKYAYRNIIPQAYLDQIADGKWTERLRQNGMDSLVVIENGRFIGTAAICLSRWEEYPGFGEIVSIYLLPDCMGKGYGTPLLKQCQAELIGRGFRRILLWVLEENTRARRFYERNGFECAGVSRVDRIGGKDLREIMYTYDCEKEVES